MSRTKTRAFTLWAAATAALALAGTAQAVDLRSWDQKINDATKRFVVLASFNSEAVLDKETQLVWQRSPSPHEVTWRQANFVSLSDPSCAAANIGGRQGWRLPTRFELLSLADRSVAGPVQLPAGHPFVGISPDAFYWTSDRSTDAADGMPRYFAISFSTQAMIHQQIEPLLNMTRVWCARGHGSPNSL
jgi:hypothetical protein